MKPSHIIITPQRATVCLGLGGTAVGAAVFLAMCAPIAFGQAGEQVYWKRLDGWVALLREKPPVGATNDEMREILRPVVETCGKLVMLRAGALGSLSLSTVNRDEFDYRVDVCTTLTVHRVWRQPKLRRRDMVDLVCVNTDKDLFKDLCRRAGLIR
jgi:hypothetical protein